MQASREILVVEDDEGIRDSVAECLECEGYAVVPAANGAEALAGLRAGARPDVVLVDLVMPVMDGAELIEEIRAEPSLRDLRIVLMTAATRLNGLPPADDYLEKPFQLEELLTTVARHCRGVAAA
jgi:two-component system, chemotaxis family, chemotaxis protein CheY